MIDWNELSNGIPGNFHGDLHFENIIINPKEIKPRLATRLWIKFELW